MSTSLETLETRSLAGIFAAVWEGVSYNSDSDKRRDAFEAPTILQVRNQGGEVVLAF